MCAIDAGSRIGAYTIVRRLGEGGMGAVFEAVHSAIGRHVAIKVLNPEYAAQKDVVGRFFNEARAANLIDHPSIVQVADFGYTADGTAYIVMEFLRGEVLSKRLREGGMPCAEAVHIARSLASVLIAAHAQHIVHRDLKPDNIMLCPDPERPGAERLKLLDFGIAKLLETANAGHVKTRTNIVMGTPAYMSPEQCQGASRVDAQSDVYSLGVMLYEMLSGRLPFIAEGSGSLIGMHLFKQAPPLHQVAPHVPENVAALVDQLLQKDKKQRPSMQKLAAQLQQLEEGDVPLPTATGGTWLSSILRTVLPGRARHSTLGFSTGQLGSQTGSTPPRQARARKTLLMGGFAGLLTVSSGFYFLAPTPHPARPPMAQAAEVHPVAARPPAITAAPPPVAEKPPQLVRWDIASDPPGAQVVREPDGFILGTTPLRHEQRAEPGQVVLSLKLAGYQLTQVTMDMQSPGQVDKSLAPAPGRVPSVTAKRRLPPPVAGLRKPPPPVSPVELRNDLPPLNAGDLLEK